MDIRWILDGTLDRILDEISDGISDRTLYRRSPYLVR